MRKIGDFSMQANRDGLYKKPKDISKYIQELYILLDAIHPRLTPVEIDQFNRAIEGFEKHNRELIHGVQDE